MKKIILTSIFLTVITITAMCDVVPSKLFNSNMVLQRNQQINVWGTANPGERITISLNGTVTEGKAGNDSKWKMVLPEFDAGGPFEMVIKGNNEITYSNVMIGDVWLASGQSNMAWRVKGSNNAKEEIANANYPHIRYFNVPRDISQQPRNVLYGGEWVECSPSVVGAFSGVAYFFARNIHLEKNVAVGILQSSWGGTIAETWTSYEMLNTVEGLKEKASSFKTEEVNWEDDIEANKERIVKKKGLIANSFQGLELGVEKPEYDDSEWELVNVPGWEKTTMNITWVRKTIVLPANVRRETLQLDLGRSKGNINVYFNGVSVGTISHDGFIKMEVPAKLVHAGKNVIAMRIANGWEPPRMYGTKETMVLTYKDIYKSAPPEHQSKEMLSLTYTPGEHIANLSGVWKYNSELEPEIPVEHKFFQFPASLFNAMIHPLVPYTIKGAIWYQGESDAGEAIQYRDVFPKLITDWRVRWGQGYFPFLFVQLANYMDPLKEPGESHWAELREAQAVALEYPNTAMVVATDVGEQLSVHPRNKQDVGARLALAARHIAYGENIVYSGPLMSSFENTGTTIEISFDHVGNGMEVKGEKLKGFAIAGSDSVFHWADAKITGEKVIVSNPLVKNPIAVRYNWEVNPNGNLYNKEGLPAAPFRTDEWNRIKVSEY